MRHSPGARFSVTFAGQVITGGTRSFTVTVCVADETTTPPQVLTSWNTMTLTPFGRFGTTMLAGSGCGMIVKGPPFTLYCSVKPAAQPPGVCVGSVMVGLAVQLAVPVLTVMFAAAVSVQTPVGTS